MYKYIVTRRCRRTLTEQQRDDLGRAFRLLVRVLYVGYVEVLDERLDDRLEHAAGLGLVGALDDELHARIVLVAQHQHADAHDRVGQQRSDGHHVDQLLQVEDRRHHACGQTRV